MMDRKENNDRFKLAANLSSESAETRRVDDDILERRRKEYLQLGTAIEQVERNELEPLDIEDIKRRGRERMGIG